MNKHLASVRRLITVFDYPGCCWNYSIITQEGSPDCNPNMKPVWLIHQGSPGKQFTSHFKSAKKDTHGYADLHRSFQTQLVDLELAVLAAWSCLDVALLGAAAEDRPEDPSAKCRREARQRVLQEMRTREGSGGTEGLPARLQEPVGGGGVAMMKSDAAT